MPFTNRFTFQLFSTLVILGMLIIGCTVLHNSRESTKRDFILLSESGAKLSKVQFADACDNEEIHCLNNVVLIIGEINRGTVNALKDFIKINSNSDASYICFDSPGGQIESAQIISEIILAGKMGTCLAEKYVIKNKERNKLVHPKCASVCNYLLLASTNRVAVGKNISFITHSAGVTISFCFCELTYGSRFAHRLLLEQFIYTVKDKERDQHLAFLTLGETIPNSAAYRLSQDELIRYAIFNNWIK